MGLMDRVLGCATTIVDETPLFEPALGRAHARIIVCVTHSKQDRKEERTHRHSLMRTITQRNSTTLCTLHARCVQFPTLVDGQPRPKISYFLFRPSLLLFIYIPDRVRSNFFSLFPTVFLSLGGEEKWRRGGDWIISDNNFDSSFFYPRSRGTFFRSGYGWIFIAWIYFPISYENYLWNLSSNQ